MSEKINQLLNTIVPGDIVIQSWLSSQGISPQLARKYCESNWLVRLGVGAYYRAGKQPQWQQAVHCLQYQQNENIHVAGLSSLALQGKAHYIQMGENSIWLNIRTNSVLPKWFMSFPTMWEAETLVNWHILRTSKLSVVKDADLTDLKVDGVQLKVSSVELAVYELLEEVPTHISFTHAAQIFQGLVNLSPRKVQSLLERSNAVQTNRIFLFLGNYFKHQWMKKIDVSKINLGSGKRHVVSNGKLDKQYFITVPEEFISSE
ncbi:type IV toxin-antitoxin system AbiEi family antitoxin [Legionella yabuuchiae]|uniref:type IV toxin-antitoxin system AbiEi family antitoxin n=1 Tax=Legionella yabuuchiae TaxID=376727 RepID=UPI00105521FB|nr:type IV toxin-antitoxin system AbiEi family antitoxin [Legionella yabuuchiae]